MAELKQAKGPILALGAVAVSALGIPPNQQGAWFELADGRWATSALHPAYVLRKADEATVFLKEIESAVRGPEKRRVFRPEVRWARTPAMLEEMLAECPNGSWVSFDIETDQVQWYDTPAVKRDGVLMLQLAWNYDFGVVVPDDLLYDSPKAQEILRRFFKRVKTVGQNAKFDTVFMQSHFDIQVFLDFDTMLAQYVLDENMPLGLKKLAALEFGMPDYEEELIRQYLSSRGDRYSKVPPEKLAQYGVIDVVVTLALREVFEARLRASNQYDSPFMSIIMNATRAFEAVELRGMQVDDEALETASRQLQAVIAEKLAALRESVNNPELNPNSTKQMAELFYDKLGFPPIKSFKVSPRSTGAEAIEKLRGRHPVVGLLEEFRRVDKLHSSYVQNVVAFRDLNGRVHARFILQGTEVGRIAVRDPALQTIARPDDIYGAMIRSMYVAGPGKILVIADYSQAELRVLAALSKEPFLLEAYRNGRDIHTEVTIAMYGPNWTKADRAVCKMFNFSYVYGGTVYSFAEGLGLPVEVAKQFVHRYDENMPIALQWKKDQFSKAQRDGYVETIFHRRRNFPFLTEDNLKEVRKASVHMPVAGTAADLTILSCIEAESSGIPVVLTVHDSVIAEVDIDKAQDAGLAMHDIMVSMGNKYLPEVPWKVDVEICHSWYGGESWELVGRDWVLHDKHSAT
jgi:DNA polymerase-1